MKFPSLRLSSVRKTLKREFIFISALIVLVVASLAISFSYRLYNAMVDRLTERVQHDAEQLDAYLRDTFAFSEFLMVRLGEDIIAHGPSDLDYISQVMKGMDTRGDTQLSMLTASTFTWVNDKNYMIVTAGGEILRDAPIDVNQRSYVQKGIIDPWKLHFSPPATGYVTGEEIIPAGMGYRDSKGQYVGAMTIGYNQEKMAAKVQQEILSPNFNFALVAKEGTLALKSGGSILLNSEDTLQGMVDIAMKKRLSNGLIIRPALIADNSEYAYYYRSQSHPFLILIVFDRELIKQEISPILSRTVVELISFGSLLILLLYWAGQRFIAPVVRLSSMAESFSGTVDKIAGSTAGFEKGQDEIMRLSQQIDRVRYVEELERIRKELTFKASLSEARKDAAEKSNRIRSEMLANMSHELRTPLNAILAFSESMTQQIFGPVENEKYQQYADDIHMAGQQLLHLVNDIVDLSKAESGRLSLEFSAVDVAEIVDNAVAFVTPDVEAQHVRISNHTGVDLPKIKGDPARLQQVLISLLVHAVKQTQEDGRITVDTVYDEHNHMVELTLLYTGEGLTEEEIAYTMERTARGAIKRSQRNKSEKAFQNLGISLPLSKKLVEMMGGEFEIDSWPERGTRIKLSFYVPPSLPTEGK